MKFNHLNVPTHWEHYWTRYPEGHTILEALIQWVSQVDDMVDNQNKLNENVKQFRNEIDNFVSRFDERLQDEVTKTLEDWQSSGFLDVVISEALQWQLDDYITTNEQDKLTLTEQLGEKATKGEITLNDLDKNKIKLDATWFDDEFNSDLSNGTITTTYVEDSSLTTQKQADRNITVGKTDFIDQPIIEPNTYVTYKIQNGVFQPATQAEIDDPLYRPYSVVEQLEPNTRYKVIKENSNRFVIGLLNQNPKDYSSLEIVKTQEMKSFGYNKNQEYFEITTDDEKVFAVVYVSNGDTENPRPRIWFEGGDYRVDGGLKLNGLFESDNIVKGKNIWNPTPINAIIENPEKTTSPRFSYVSDSNNTSYISPVEGGIDYHLSKRESDVFRVGTVSEYPRDNMVVDVLYSYVGSDINEITVHTPENAKYLITYLAWQKEAPSFVQIEKGNRQTEWETPGYKFSQEANLIEEIKAGEDVPTDLAKNVFVEKMNEKAKFLNMENTLYNNASGVTEDLNVHYTTASDLLKLGVHAFGYERLLKVWCKPSYDIDVEGENARIVTVESSVIKPTLDDFYHILGGKTGTAADFQNMWVAVEHPNGKDTLVGVVSGMHTLNRYQSAKELFDIAVAKMNGEDVSTMDIGCNYAIVGVLPYRHPFSTIRNGIDILWRKNENEIIAPASTSKTMAVIVALDHITNFEESVTITENDFVMGAGSELFPVGDVVKVKDLFYGAMLPSQNTLTETLRRVAGEKIIISRNQ